MVNKTLVKIEILLGYLVLFLIVVSSLLYPIIPVSSLKTLFYSKVLSWVFLVGWILLVRKAKLKAGFSLLSGIVFYSFGVFLSTFGFLGLGEVIFWVSLVVFLIGIAQALMEFRKTDGKTH